MTHCFMKQVKPVQKLNNDYHSKTISKATAEIYVCVGA